MARTVYLGAENAATLPRVDAHNRPFDEKKVEMLVAQNNRLEAAALESLVDFATLRSLDLSANEVDDEKLRSLKVSSSLKDLDLSGNKICHAPFDSQENAFSNLTSLNLANNKLDPDFVNHIVHMKNLEHLDLTNTKLEQLPDKIRTLRKIKTLKLVGCDLAQFPRVICSFKDLTHLTLDLKGRPKIKKMGQALERWLEQEIMNFCAVEPDEEGVLKWSYSRGHISKLFDSFSELEQSRSSPLEVRELWLNCCLLVDETGEVDDVVQEELANGLAHESLAQLSLLSLCTNSLRAAPDLSRFQFLKKLGLCRNRLTEVPASVRALPLLTHLFITENLIENLVFAKRDFPALMLLDLKENPLCSDRTSAENCLMSQQYLGQKSDCVIDGIDLEKLESLVYSANFSDANSAPITPYPVEASSSPNFTRTQLHLEMPPVHIQESHTPNSPTPTVVEQPSDLSVSVNGLATFKCVADGLGPLSFRWHKDGKTLKGEESNLLEIQRAQTKDQGKYQCCVSNVFGETLSNEVSLKVNPAATGALWAHGKVALLIGNGDYDHLDKLTGVENDMRKLTEVLRNQLGFEVVSLMDLDLAEMRAAMHAFVEALSPQCYAFFAYSGHGFESSGQTYLLPPSAPQEFDLDFDGCLCVEEFLQALQDKPTALNTVVLDMCRAKSDNSPDLTFTPSAAGNTVVAYAASFNNQAYEMEGIGSVFMKYLVECLPSKQDIKSLLNQVQEFLGHETLTNEIQFPEIKTNLREKRSLTDVDRLPIESTTGFRRWKEVSNFSATKCRERSFVQEFPDGDAKLVVNFCSPHANVVHVEARVTPGTNVDRISVTLPEAENLGVSLTGKWKEDNLRVWQSVVTNLQTMRDADVLRFLVSADLERTSVWKKEVALEPPLKELGLSKTPVGHLYEVSHVESRPRRSSSILSPAASRVSSSISLSMGSSDAFLSSEDAFPTLDTDLRNPEVDSGALEAEFGFSTTEARSGASEAGSGSMEAETSAVEAGFRAVEAGFGAVEAGSVTVKPESDDFRAGHGAVEAGFGAVEVESRAADSRSSAVEAEFGAVEEEGVAANEIDDDETANGVIPDLSYLCLSEEQENSEAVSGATTIPSVDSSLVHKLEIASMESGSAFAGAVEDEVPSLQLPSTNFFTIYSTVPRETPQPYDPQQPFTERHERKQRRLAVVDSSSPQRFRVAEDHLDDSMEPTSLAALSSLAPLSAAPSTVGGEPFPRSLRPPVDPLLQRHRIKIPTEHEDLSHENLDWQVLTTTNTKDPRL